MGEASISEEEASLYQQYLRRLADVRQNAQQDDFYSDLVDASDWDEEFEPETEEHFVLRIRGLTPKERVSEVTKLTTPFHEWQAKTVQHAIAVSKATEEMLRRESNGQWYRELQRE